MEVNIIRWGVPKRRTKNGKGERSELREREQTVTNVEREKGEAIGRRKELKERQLARKNRNKWEEPKGVGVGRRG